MAHTGFASAGEAQVYRNRKTIQVTDPAALTVEQADGDDLLVVNTADGLGPYVTIGRGSDPGAVGDGAIALRVRMVKTTNSGHLGMQIDTTGSGTLGVALEIRGPGNLQFAQAGVQHVIDAFEGTLKIRSGIGLVVQDGSGANDKIGFYGAAPVTRRSDAGALTDNTTGAADGTVADVGAAFNQATLNNNFADLIDKINALRTALRDLGLMA
jgi:hypothetical protein